MRNLLPLASWAHANRVSYNRALNAAIKGEIPARRIDGRWYVESAALRPHPRRKSTNVTSGGACRGTN